MYALVYGGALQPLDRARSVPSIGGTAPSQQDANEAAHQTPRRRAAGPIDFGMPLDSREGLVMGFVGFDEAVVRPRYVFEAGRELRMLWWCWLLTGVSPSRWIQPASLLPPATFTLWSSLISSCSERRWVTWEGRSRARSA